MAGGGSSQSNKSHKAGRRAGKGVRARNRHGGVEERRLPAAAMVKRGKEARLQAAAAARTKARQEVLERRRHAHAPLVIQMLAMSSEVDMQKMWDVIMCACRTGSDVQSLKSFAQADSTDEMAEPDESFPFKMETILVPGRHKMRVTLLPPILGPGRMDPLTLVDVSKAADIVALCISAPAAEKGLDEGGRLALSVLRGMGRPHPVVLVQGNGSSLKERSAAKKVVTATLSTELAGDLKVVALDTVPDCVQLLRTLVEAKVEAPMWRRNRPHLLVEGAEYSETASTVYSSRPGVLYLTGYVRAVGLTANQLVTIPGGGDFQIGSVQAAQELVTQRGARDAAAMEDDLPVLALPDADRETLVRENIPEEEPEEQTWPTEAELAEASASKRKLAPGTSDYQACWILDDEDADDDDAQGHDEDGDADMAGASGRGEHAGSADDVPELAPLNEDNDDAMSEGDADEDEATRSANLKRLREARRRDAEQDDLNFPDEVEVPPDVPARTRFQKYRGLKSFRTSAWDAKEGLPKMYSRVFAFQNNARAQKRAREYVARALDGSVPGCVATGTFVRVAVLNVSRETAERVCSQVSASLLGATPPLVVFGLLQHESKLSVLNMAVKKVEAHEQPIANKEELLFVTGVRTFAARPVISTDEYNSDKFKMERFLHPGRSCMMSVFAPILFGPLPVLVFKRDADGGPPTLVAVGSVRSSDPDRIVLKKIILSGYPTKVHKKKAIVKYMFFNPDDVRWFKPLELWTKYGRKGRIKEPVGTHGHMKCVFDAPVTQADSICLSLYKRVFPKWPEDMTFN